MRDRGLYFGSNQESYVAQMLHLFCDSLADTAMCFYGREFYRELVDFHIIIIGYNPALKNG